MNSAPLATFMSDNAGPVAAEIMQALLAENSGAAASYGDDATTRAAAHAFRSVFGADADSYFALTGTGANVVALSSMVHPSQSVVTAASSHIHAEECGAFERFGGSKVIAVETDDGKLHPRDIDRLTQWSGDHHNVRAAAISISQPTEFGEVYGLAELRDLCAFAHSRGLKVHMDGARIANAAAFLDCDLRACTVDVGVDALTFGGTKNGLQYGEAIVFFAGAPAVTHATRVQAMQLAPKMRFIAAQFVALLRDDLWRRYARHTNAMAAHLAAALSEISGVRTTRKPHTNAVFVALPPAAIRGLRARYRFYTYDATAGEVRFMTHTGTSVSDIETFVDAVRRVMARGKARTAAAAPAGN